MRRAIAALLVFIALATTSTLYVRSAAREPAPPVHVVTAVTGTRHALLSLRRFEASGFLTRHAMVEQYRDRLGGDTSEIGYWLTDHRLRTRHKLVLTITSGDSVVRADLGFATTLISSVKGAKMRAQLTDFLDTFVPRADSASVAPLRAQIAARSEVKDFAIPVPSSQSGDHHVPGSPFPQPKLLQTDRIFRRYTSSQLWIDTLPGGEDAVTLVRLAIPGAAPSRVLAVDWVRRPEVLGGTVEDLWKCLTQTDVQRVAGVKAGGPIRYRFTREHRVYDMYALFHPADSLRELTIALSNPPDEYGRRFGTTNDFLFLAEQISPVMDRRRLAELRIGPRLPTTFSNPDVSLVTAALLGTHGPVVMNFSESSFRFDQAAGGLPRMTLAARGRFGAATDSVPK